MSPVFKALIDANALAGKVEALNTIEVALQAIGTAPAELAYTQRAIPTAWMTIKGRMELAGRKPS